MAEVRFEEIRKTFGKVTAVDDVNLHVGEGEFVVLLGPPAAGRRHCCGASPGSSASTVERSTSATATPQTSRPGAGASRWSSRATPSSLT